MKAIGDRLVINKKRIVIFGAGKIGRSFIGQLFSQGGYEVVFVDIDQHIVDAMNEQGKYKVVIKEKKPEEIVVENIRAVYGVNTEEVIIEIAKAGILAVSVGKNALSTIVPVIARGIERRFADISTAPPLDIILAENMRGAASYMREELVKCLPDRFPHAEKVGLIETSIGKMVPIMTEADIKEDPLLVFAEGYNELILDKRGFQNEIPEVAGLAPKDNIKAWVDRKAFIHNLGHATAAYYGFYHLPGYTFMHEILADEGVYQFTKSVMLQAADVLLKYYPVDFTRQHLEQHIVDLLNRFRNEALGDTIFRVGHDLRRKLGADDRFMGIIHMARDLGLPYKKILQAFSYGFHFKATDEYGHVFPGDVQFLNEWKIDQRRILTQVCGLSDEADQALAMQIGLGKSQ